MVDANLPDGFEERMQYGMISRIVPLERYPETYNGQALAVASLANQKRHARCTSWACTATRAAGTGYRPAGRRQG